MAIARNIQAAVQDVSAWSSYGLLATHRLYATSMRCGPRPNVVVSLVSAYISSFSYV